MALGYVDTLVTQQVDGTAHGASTSTVTIIAPAARIPIPGNYFHRIGQMLQLRAWGRMSNIITTPGTLQFFFQLGASGTIIVAQSPAFALNIVAKTNVSWMLEWDLTLRSIGAAATFMHQGRFTSESVIGSPLPTAGGSGSLMIPASAPAVGTSFDSLVTNIADLLADWSINNAGNTIQTHGYSLVSLN